MDTFTRSINNNEAIQHAVSMIVKDHVEALANNTNKLYAPKQAEFRQWCGEREFEDGAIVTEGKLVLFLIDVIIPKGNKRVKREDGTVKALSVEGVEAYIKAVVDLYKLQLTLSPSSQCHPHPRGKAVKTLLQTMKRNDWKRKRESLEDRGIGTVLDGYNLADMTQLSEYWLGMGTWSALRDRVDFLLGHALLARGKNKRFIQLPDLLTLSMTDEGPQLCTPLVVVISRGKTNQFGRVEYGAAMRCK